MAMVQLWLHHFCCFWSVAVADTSRAERHKFAYFLTVVFSRGVSYAVLAVILFIKREQLTSAGFANLGHDLALASLFVGPAMSVIGQIQARRIMASMNIRANIFPVFLLLMTALLLLSVVWSSEPAWRLMNLDLRPIIITGGFLLSYGLVGMIVLWVLACKSQRYFLTVCLGICLSMTVIICSRLVFKIGYENSSLVFEGLILWGFAASILLAFLLDPDVKIDGELMYPYSLSTIARYAAIVVFYNGILSVDWQLLNLNLKVDDYSWIAAIRIACERFLLPLLAATTSALLLNRYQLGRENNNTEVGPFIGRLFEKKRLSALFGVVAVVTLIFMLPTQPRIILILALGYLIFGINSYFLDLFQARKSFRHLVGVLIMFILIYALLSKYVMLNFGLIGHAVFWVIANFALLSIIARPNSLNAVKI